MAAIFITRRDIGDMTEKRAHPAAHTTDSDAPNNLDAELSAAQIDKIRAEIADIQEKQKNSFRLDRYIPFLTLICTLAAIIVGIAEFKMSAAEDRKKFTDTMRANQAQFASTLNATAAQNQETRVHDYAKDYASSRSATYLEAVNDASEIATEPSANPERIKAEHDFWQIYWGHMILVQDRAVELQMINFGNCLNGIDADCSDPQTKNAYLQHFSFQLAKACRVSQAAEYDADDQDFLNHSQTDLIEDDHKKFPWP